MSNLLGTMKKPCPSPVKPIAPFTKTPPTKQCAKKKAKTAVIKVVRKDTTNKAKTTEESKDGAKKRLLCEDNKAVPKKKAKTAVIQVSAKQQGSEGATFVVH